MGRHDTPCSASITMGDMQLRLNWPEIAFMALVVGSLGLLFLGVPLNDTLLTIGVFAAFGTLGLLAGVALELIRLRSRSGPDASADSPDA